MDNKLTDQIIEEKLERNKIKKEKSRQAAKKYYDKKRAKVGLTTEEIETARRKKISDAVRKRYDEGFKNKKLSPEKEKIRAEKASKTMKEKYANMTDEERKLAVSHLSHSGCKHSDEAKKKMSDARKKYELENTEEFQKRYEKMKQTTANRTPEEKEKTRIKTSKSLSEAWVKIKLDDDKLKERNEKISINWV